MHKRAQAREMSLIERLRTADGHADAMQGDGIVLPDAFQRPVRRAAGAHIVFGMNFEEKVLRPIRQDGAQVFVLETCPG
jgi:hypothetical protein